MFFTCLFSNVSFSQARDAGGSGDGLGAPQPCPTSFTRNNGDGSCKWRSTDQVVLHYPPTVAPTLESILYNDEPLFSNGMPVEGNLADYATKGYVSFCLPTSNIPPAIKLTLQITYGWNATTCTISGTQ
jgi:hypothetical protein